MKYECLASLFGTGFSLWDAREVRPVVSRLFPGPYGHFFGTVRAVTEWNW
jgi:hypothetical protein